MNNIDSAVRKAIKSIGTALATRDRVQQGAKARFDESLKGSFERLRTAFEAFEIPKDKQGLSQMRRAMRDAENSDAGQVLASVLHSDAVSDLSPKTWSNYKTGLFKAYILGVAWFPHASEDLKFPWPDSATATSTIKSVATEKTKAGETTTSTSTTKSVATEETKAGETTTLTKESVAKALATDLERLALLGEREAKLAKTLKDLLTKAGVMK
jgi:hypothetical protein